MRVRMICLWIKENNKCLFLTDFGMNSTLKIIME